jgi:hypothetical protein
MHPWLIGDVLATRSAFGTLLVDVGRICALLEFGAVQRHQERLATAHQRLAERSERATIRLAAPAEREVETAPVSRRRAA